MTTAIVTGASRGIGRQAALRLARDGHAVVVGYVGSHAAAQATAATIVEHGGSAVPVAADVADPKAVQGLFDAAEQHFGGVDVVVNAAGLATPTLVSVADTDFDLLDRIHQVNVRGTFAVLQQAARRVRDGGAIITFSTSVIGLAPPGYATYASSKAAVEATTLILARELRGRDITVNCVAPGPTATELFFQGKDQATVDRFASQPPLERLGLPEDVSEVVAFLAGPGRWVNGQVLRVNGGIV